MILWLILLLIVVWYIADANVAFKRRPLPPGPSGSLFFGVKSQLSPTAPWKKYHSWAQHFGSPIISFRVYNRRIVVLNDSKSVRELLNRRASVYSDRPKAWMYHELCARGKSVFNISSLDERHKEYRKLLSNGLGAQATKYYWPILEDAVATLIQGLQDSPKRYEAHLRRNSAAVIMNVAYGYTVVDDDPFIGIAEESARISGQALAPGRWLVDYYPIVRFLPMWFPFADFRRQGEEWKQKLDSLSEVPHKWVKKQMAIGQYTESFTSRHLEEQSADEDIVKWCAGGLYAGAADTTVSGMMSFILLMALHPDVQKRAQAEVDTIVGRHGSPCCGDNTRLVYLLAVMKEVLRYAPIANLALPHRLTEEDTYEGYRIPKDATVVANTWAIMHDPELYPLPSVFDPTRFLGESEKDSTGLEINPDSRTFAFGYGRRTCPGVQFAETSMLLTMANILAKFDIILAAQSTVPSVEFTSGITSHVKAFPIEIIPRS